MNYNGQPGKNPRILIVTPEITYLPRGMGNMANRLTAKAGGLADVSASLVGALFDMGADVHVALPHYRRMFNIDVGNFINNELRAYKQVLPKTRIHLAQDRSFYYRNEVYSSYNGESNKVALAFQREVINNIIPHVNPDLIHCNDWMTGLIPGSARRQGIPSLFTLHNIHTHNITLEAIEEAGIDAAEFWPNLFYNRIPFDYEETRSHNPVDLLASGIFASHFVNTVSSSFLEEICDGQHEFVPAPVRYELINKHNAGCAFGILNAPDPTYTPEQDNQIDTNYNAANHRQGKTANKVIVQERLGLRQDPSCPMMFWPSRLDPMQKGPDLLAHILYDTIHEYRAQNLQLVIVANGPYQEVFHNLVRFHDMHQNVSVCDFDEKLARMCYAGSDFILMPSRFEPCGLPQMIGMLYGSLPVVHDTGGLHDTVEHLNLSSDTGNGFVFETHDSGGLRWAIDEAMRFHMSNEETRSSSICRIMNESKASFNHSVSARRYFDLYEKMLQRPIVQSF